MKRLLLTMVVLMLAATAFAQNQATIQDIRGKVEVQVANGTWAVATRGMSIDTGTTISTGFNSTAVLRVGQSTVTVQQLTRMTLSELLQKEGTATTTFSLAVGRVQAQVRSSEGVAQNFQIKSPISTAAVRGTEFDFDGYKLQVQEGVVAFVTALQQRRDIIAGQQSSTDGEGVPTSGGDEKDGESTVDLSNGPDQSTGFGQDVPTGSISITWS